MRKEDLHLEEFIQDRNLSSESKRDYSAAVKSYTEFNKMTLAELINEADTEEDENIRMKKRKIKKKLKNYRNYLLNEKKYSINTIKSYFTKIKTIYNHFKIEIPYIPPMNLNETIHERFTDIPTKKNIKDALEATNNLKYKALILFMSSSGSAMHETLSITIQDFIKATSEYHSHTHIEDVLNHLSKKKDVIPLFEMIRSKTNYPYYTCCSPEAVESILRYLKTRKKLKKDDKLFNITKTRAFMFFKQINDKLGWGKVKNYIFFHSHALRKFHATMIEETGLANALQGRKPDPITGAYFKVNPKRIKEKYTQYLPKLTINETKVNILNDEGYKKLEKLENELKIEKQRFEEFKTQQEEREKKILQELGKKN